MPPKMSPRRPASRIQIRCFHPQCHAFSLLFSLSLSLYLVLFLSHFLKIQFEGTFSFSGTYTPSPQFLFRIRKCSDPNLFSVQSCHTELFLSAPISSETSNHPPNLVTSSQVTGHRESFRRRKGIWSSLFWCVGTDRLPLYIHPESSHLYCGMDHSPYRITSCPPRLLRAFLGTYNLRFERKVLSLNGWHHFLFSHTLSFHFSLSLSLQNSFH